MTAIFGRFRENKRKPWAFVSYEPLWWWWQWWLGMVGMGRDGGGMEWTAILRLARRGSRILPSQSGPGLIVRQDSLAENTALPLPPLTRESSQERSVGLAKETRPALYQHRARFNPGRATKKANPTHASPTELLLS